jgi:glycosyltransferase involved in cell wall biosynthesis
VERQGLKRESERIARARRIRQAAEKKTKVAIVIEATIGGTREHLRQIARRINLRRFDVTVICSALRDTSFNQDIDRMRKWGLNVAVLPMQREIRPVQDFIAFLWLCWHFNRQGYDVVHTHSSKAGLLGRIAAAVCAVPRVIHTPHTFAFQSPGCSGLQAGFYRFLERFAGNYAHRLVLLSDAQRERARQEHLVHPGRMVVIPNGVSIRRPEEIASNALRRSDLGLIDSDLVVGCVGRLTRQKGHEHLLAAAETVCRECPEAVFLLIGDGERRRELELEVERRNLANRVRFLGSREDIQSIYPVLDVLAMPSAYEGMPYAALEAMACARPVVAFRIPELEPLIVDGRTGLFAASDNDAELAGRLLKLLRDAELRKGLGEEARRHVAEHYSSERFIQRIEALYSGQE